MCLKLVSWYNIIFHLTFCMICILREVMITCFIVLLLAEVVLHVVRGVIDRVLIVIDTSPLVKVIIVTVTHWVIEIEESSPVVAL